MDKALKDIISSLLGTRVISASAISGGDIAQAFLITTSTERFFCKLHHKPEAYAMFQSEADGLNAIRSTNTIKTPQVFYCEPFEQGAFLIMEYIESKRPQESEMRTFGRQLAHLHLHDGASFGWKADNFIGSLPQLNREHKTWSEFYVQERLQPQLQIASDRGFLTGAEIPSRAKMLSVFKELSHGVKPSLIHGDLWSGNFLIGDGGNAYLIDPAIYFGHGEVDIAMSRLFGGFGSAFYRAYEELLPGDAMSPDRINIYQLYYLLVHLNLFGRSYYASVSSLLKQYFH